MKTLLVLLALAGSAADLSAQVALTGARWQVLPSQRVRRKEARDIERLALPPGGPQEPIAAVVILKNEGARTEVGVQLRYAVSVRVVPVGGSADAGTWTVPFWTEVERVPQIGAGKEKKVVIRNLHLDAHLRQLFREGFWLNAVRLQVMTELKRGEALGHKVLETELPVDWEGKNP